MNKLESALALAARGFRVFPLIPNTKLPAVKDFSGQATTDKEKIVSWFGQKDFNIGISTDNLLVVDVDVKSKAKDGLATMEKLNKLGKTFPPTTQQITASGGLHLIYDTPHPVSNSVSKLGPGLDVRAKGGYIVGSGSTINGKKYVINTQSRNMVSNWILEACNIATEKKPNEPKKVIKVDLVRAKATALEYLKKLPPCEAGERNHSAYKVAAKLKDFGLPENETFMLMWDEWKCEPQLETEELQHCVHSAFRYGKDGVGVDSPEAMFGEEEKQEEGIHPIDDMNQEYAFVTTGSGHRIIHETFDEDGEFLINYLKEESFHKRLAWKMHQVDSKITPLTRFWISHPKRRTYKGVMFAPGEKPNPDFYNLWRGFSLKAIGQDEKVTREMERGVELFHEHILQNVCDGHIEYYQWVLAWCAHLVQKPNEKPESCLVLRGRKGVGKNVVVDVLTRFFPPHAMTTADKRYMTGNFNSHMEKLLIFCLDEAFWSGSKDSEGILKSLITSPKIEIEKKGFDSMTMKSKVRLIILGNEDWVVPASHEERRFAVFDVTEGRMQDRKFFGEMKSCMDKGADRLLFTQLLEMDISKIDINVTPKTEGLLRQKHNSLAPLEQWWMDCLSQGYIDDLGPFQDGKWITEIDKNQFKNAFASYAAKHQMRSWLPSDVSLLQKLTVFIPKIALGLSAETNLLCVNLPSLAECRNAWDNFQGQKTLWRKDS